MIESGRFLQQRYRIDKQIGQGGMGAVYVATDERFGSTVAIKETLCMDDNFRKAIEREARLLNSLKHGALPRVSDHFLEDEGQFLVMEYIQGEDLAHMMERRHEPFPVETVLNWADQLLDALDYLHTQDIPVIHRDIKPQNLKLTSRGQIVLLDFGLAKGNPTDAGHQTAAKSIFGYSRNYASLEQIQGTGTDPRSDLYSLTATLYHLLTGVAPEDALTRAMAVLSHKPDPLVPANSLRSDIPAGVAGVLQRAMDLNAGGRPASAAEMRQMFRESANYAYLADFVTAPQINVTGPIPQPTKLRVDGTRADDNTPLTDVKTEVLPANLSELTSIRPGASTAPVASTSMPSIVPKRRRVGMAIGSLGVVLLGCLVAVGLYVAKPALFSGASPTAEPVKDVAIQPVQPEAPANTDPGATNENGVEQAAGEPDSELSKPADEPKQVETTKNNKAAQRSQTENKEDRSVDPDVPGDITITERGSDGQTTTTKIKPAPIPPYMQGQPPPNGYDPFPREFTDPKNWPQMTPEQRRKLQEAIRRAQRQQQVYRPPQN
jgi:serine/threonine protein kinase